MMTLKPEQFSTEELQDALFVMGKAPTLLRRWWGGDREEIRAVLDCRKQANTQTPVTSNGGDPLREQEHARQREALAYFESLPLDAEQMRGLVARLAPTYTNALTVDDSPERMRAAAAQALTLQSLYGGYFSNGLIRASEITGGYAAWNVDAK